MFHRVQSKTSKMSAARNSACALPFRACEHICGRTGTWSQNRRVWADNHQSPHKHETSKWLISESFLLGVSKWQQLKQPCSCVRKTDHAGSISFHFPLVDECKPVFIWGLKDLCLFLFSTATSNCTRSPAWHQLDSTEIKVNPAVIYRRESLQRFFLILEWEGPAKKGHSYHKFGQPNACNGITILCSNLVFCPLQFVHEVQQLYQSQLPSCTYPAETSFNQSVQFVRPSCLRKSNQFDLPAVTFEDTTCRDVSLSLSVNI